MFVAKYKQTKTEYEYKGHIYNSYFMALEDDIYELEGLLYFWKEGEDEQEFSLSRSELIGPDDDPKVPKNCLVVLTDPAPKYIHEGRSTWEWRERSLSNLFNEHVAGVVEFTDENGFISRINGRVEPVDGRDDIVDVYELVEETLSQVYSAENMALFLGKA